MEEPTTHSALVMCDDAPLRADLVVALSVRGIEARCGSLDVDTLTHVQGWYATAGPLEGVAVFVIDATTAYGRCLDLLDAIRRRDPLVPVVILAQPTMLRGADMGANFVMDVGAAAGDIADAVGRAIAQSRS